jgi:hypothetical protein
MDLPHMVDREPDLMGTLDILELLQRAILHNAIAYGGIEAHQVLVSALGEVAKERGWAVSTSLPDPPSFGTHMDIYPDKYGWDWEPYPSFSYSPW